MSNEPKLKAGDMPRLISDIATAEAAEKRRRSPDLAGQIVSLKTVAEFWADVKAEAAKPMETV